MLCLEIIVNGERLCTAGIGEFGCLTSILSWVQVSPENRLPPDEEWRTGIPNLRVGGFVDETHFEWLNQKLKVGDEVSIRIIEADTPDAPKLQYHDDDDYEPEDS